MIECDASTGFLPTAELLRPHVRGARLLALNSPLNPTGTVFDARSSSPTSATSCSRKTRGADRPSARCS